MRSENEIRVLLTKLYALVSGPPGFERDWTAQAELFHPSAKMIRTSVDADGTPQALVMTIQDYPKNFRKLLDGVGFYERETHCNVDVFGNMAHAFSTYEAWADAAQTEFIKRGINSIQFYNDGRTWRIVNMIWDDERPGLVMPSRYKP